MKKIEGDIPTGLTNRYEAGPNDTVVFMVKGERVTMRIRHGKLEVRTDHELRVIPHSSNNIYVEPGDGS